VRRAQTPDVLERPPRASECSRAGHDYGDTVSSDEESSGFQAEHAAYFGASRVDLERVSSPESEESDEYPISEGGTAMRARKKPDTSTTTTTTTATVATKTTAAVTTSTTEITPTPVEWTDSDQKPSSSNLFDDVDLSQETTLSPKEKAVQIVSWKINCEACQGKDAQSREALKQKWRRPKQCSCIQELARQIQLCPEILSDRNPSLLDVAIKHGELAMIDFLFRRGIDPKCSKHCCRWADGQIRAKDNRLVKKLSGYIWRYQEQQIQAQPGNGREDANQQRADRQKALNIIVWKKVDLETEMSIIQWIRGLMGGVTSEHFEEVSTTMLAAIWASMILNDNRFFDEELGKLKESKDKTEQYLYRLLVKGKVGQKLVIADYQKEIEDLKAENARLVKERDEANKRAERTDKKLQRTTGKLQQTTGKLQQTTGKLQQTTGKLQQKEEELCQSKRKTEETELKLEGTQREKSDLEFTIREFRESERRWKESFDIAWAQYQESYKRNKELQEDIAKMKRDMATTVQKEVQKEVKKEKKERELLEERMQQMQAQIGLLFQQKQEQGQRPSTPSSHKPGLFQ
jgi:hypothetical protein